MVHTQRRSYNTRRSRPAVRQNGCFAESDDSESADRSQWRVMLFSVRVAHVVAVTQSADRAFLRVLYRGEETKNGDRYLRVRPHSPPERFVESVMTGGDVQRW